MNLPNIRAPKTKQYNVKLDANMQFIQILFSVNRFPKTRNP